MSNELLEALGVEPPPVPQGSPGPSYEDVLIEITDSSGGRYRRIPRTEDMPTVARTLLDELSSRFIITFATSGVGERGSCRSGLGRSRASSDMLYPGRPTALVRDDAPVFDRTFRDIELGDLELAEAENLRRVYDAVRVYAEEPHGWLVLTGTYGCGKTHLAAAIANHQLAKRQTALFVVVPDLLDHLRSTFNPQSPISYDKLFDQVRRAPLLVLDDLGTESATPWARACSSKYMPNCWALNQPHRRA